MTPTTALPGEKSGSNMIIKIDRGNQVVSVELFGQTIKLGKARWINVYNLWTSMQFWFRLPRNLAVHTLSLAIRGCSSIDPREISSLDAWTCL